jgi:hypothetical protein
MLSKFEELWAEMAFHEEMIEVIDENTDSLDDFGIAQIEDFEY